MGIFTTFAIGAVAGGTTWELYKRRGDLTPARFKSIFQRKQAVPKESNAPQTAPVEIVLDQLEAIHGIGPVYARRLNEAGIFTYANLAQTAPKQLIAIVAPNSKLTPDVAAWINEARILME